MSNSSYIKNPRQKRAIDTLINSTSIQVKDLGQRSGALNPAQTIMELRCQGFREIIKTRRLSYLDRDGHTCKLGEYYISENLKPLAEAALKNYAASNEKSNKTASSGKRHRKQRRV